MVHKKKSNAKAIIHKKKTNTKAINLKAVDPHRSKTHLFIATPSICYKCGSSMRVNEMEWEERWGKA